MTKNKTFLQYLTVNSHLRCRYRFAIIVVNTALYYCCLKLHVQAYFFQHGQVETSVSFK